MSRQPKMLSPRKLKAMKRIGAKANIIDEIISEANLRESIARVMRGRKRRRTREGRWILQNQDRVVEILRERIGSGEFTVTSIGRMTVTDGPKIREVQFCKRRIEAIGLHAIMRVVEAKVHTRYVSTTAASIKGRGVHYLLRKIREDFAKDPRGMRYVYKYDIRKFYQSIDQDIMMYCLRRMFKDKKLLTLLERFVRALPSGMSIGFRSSQGLANMLLSMFLGHYMKDQKGRKHAYWYCDDGSDHSSEKSEAWAVRDLTHHRMDMMKLEIKSNERVFPARLGVDYLGYVIYPTHTLLRKRNKKNAARRLHKIKSKKRRQEIIASLYGQCKHADCHNLFYKLTGIKMSEFKKLKDLGIKAKYADGKKRFDGLEVNMADLVGEEFLIMDFEVGVVTKPQRREYDEKVSIQRRELEHYLNQGIKPPTGFLYPDQVPQPIGKYVVSIKRNVGQANECLQRVFTGDTDNKSILDQMAEQDLLGKVLCTVKQVRCKSFTRYILS